MENFFIPLIIVIAFLIFGIILIKSFYFPAHGENVEIIIDGDADPTSLEKLVISAKFICEKHLNGATVYIQGGDDKIVNMLCRQYGILRK